MLLKFQRVVVDPNKESLIFIKNPSYKVLTSLKNSHNTTTQAKYKEYYYTPYLVDYIKYSTAFKH